MSGSTVSGSSARSSQALVSETWVLGGWHLSELSDHFWRLLLALGQDVSVASPHGPVIL